MEPGVADAQLAAHRAGHRTLERRDPPRVHDPADVVGVGPHQLGDRDPKVVSRYLRVAVDAGDDLVAGRPDRRVQRVGCLAGGAGHGPHPRVRGGQALGDGVGAVLRRPQGEDDLERPG